MRLADLDVIARRNDGILRQDATDLHPDVWRRAIDAGTLIRMHPGVARCVCIEPTERRRIRAATLAVDDSVASHRSAAVVWRFLPERDDATVHVTGVGTHRHHSGLAGVVCHRPDDRLDVRSVVRDGVPATPPVRTLVDLGITDPDLVVDAVGAALSSGVVTVAGLDAGLRRHARKGRTGVVALRTAISHWSLDGRPADSVLEREFADLCAANGLPAVVAHEVIEGWEVDFRFVGTAVVVECDGWTTHGRRRDQFERDRRKDDDLRAAGWIPARLSYRAITQRPDDTVRRLRRLLDRWGRLRPPDADARAS